MTPDTPMTHPGKSEAMYQQTFCEKWLTYNELKDWKEELDFFQYEFFSLLTAGPRNRMPRSFEI